MTEHTTETAHLRRDYYGPKESETTACGIALPEADVFAHPDDVTCPACLSTTGMTDEGEQIELDPHAEACGCPQQQYDIHLGTGCKWFPPIAETEGVRTRVARQGAAR